MVGNAPEIKTIFLKNMIFMGFVSLSLFCALWIHNEYKAFKTESEMLRTDYTESQKAALKTHVNGAVGYIRYMRGLTEERLKAEIRNRAIEAHQIADNLYRKYYKTVSPEELKTMIREALRPIRFNRGRGYYFAFTMDGIEQLFADRPELEGKNMLQVRGPEGVYVVREMIDLVKEKDEGFYHYLWTKPGENKAKQNFPKIAYIKKFKPLGWVIGTGEYLDDVETMIQEEVIHRLAEIRFGDEGYLFGSTYRGAPLFTNGHVTKGGSTIWDLADPNGLKIIQEQRKLVDNPEGGYVRYSWKKLSSDTPLPKISYVVGIPEWGWMIGAGAYLDTIETKIMDNLELLKQNLISTIIKSIVIIALLTLFVFIWARFISNRINDSISSFSAFFKNAATRSVSLNPDALYFKEFREIAISANEMLSARDAAENALRNSEEHLRSVYRAANTVAFVTTDLNGNHSVIQDFSPGAEAVFGYSRDDVTGMPVTLLMPDDIRHELDRMQEIIMESDSGVSGETTLITKSGDLFPALFTLHPKHDGSGALTQAVAVVIDITRQKEAEQRRIEFEGQLRNFQKMEAIGTLAGGVAHEFNNILGIILGNAELSIEDLPDDSSLQEFLGEIMSASLRGREVVRQLLSFSRTSEKEKKPLELAPIVKESVKLLRVSIYNQIEIRETISDDCPSVLADPAQIHQVVVNLCTNSADAIEGDEGGVINISLEPVLLAEDHPELDQDMTPGSYVRLIVSDSGKGIPRDHLEKIFDPFFTTKDVDRGTGLGLSVVHGIAKSHGASVRVQSTAGQGTEITLCFPAIKAEGGSDVKFRKNLPTGSERILFVDDEPAIAALQKHQLERIGYSVEIFTSPERAFEAFSTAPESYDLVVSDLAMPGIPGDSLLKQMLKIRPDLKTILCTGYSETLSDRKRSESGITAVLIKPFSKKNFADLIREVLDER